VILGGYESADLRAEVIADFCAATAELYSVGRDLRQRLVGRP